jgi:hypothetical protein
MDSISKAQVIHEFIERGRAAYVGGGPRTVIRFLFSTAMSVSQFVLLPFLLWTGNMRVQLVIVLAGLLMFGILSIIGFIQNKRLRREFRELCGSENPFRILLFRKGVPWTELASPLEEDLVSAVRSARESEVKIDDETELYLSKRLGRTSEWVFWTPYRFGVETEREILLLLGMRPVSAVARFELLRRAPSLRKFSEFQAIMEAR